MNNDLISISEAKKLGATCLARRNENGQLEAIINLDNAPTVEYPFYQEAYQTGYEEGRKDSVRPQGKWIDEDNGCFNFKKCSVCNEAAEWLDGGSQLLSNFCSNCGARMKGGEEMREGDET